MRNSIYKFVLFFSLLVVLTSCIDREGCTDPASDNFDINAEIDNGTCIPMTEKFLGLYDVQEDCEYDTYLYPMSIYASFQDPFEIVITNFGDLSIDVYALVDRNFLVIPDQIFLDNGDEIAILDGDGEILNGVLSIRYLYGQNGSPVELCRIDAQQF